jgi:hypothetical protein
MRVVFAAVVAVTAACGTTAETPGQTNTQPATAPAQTVAPASLSAWQGRGATEVPPPELQTVSLKEIQVIDQAGGAVSEKDVTAWAAALLRAINFEYWAVSHQQDRFLVQSGLSSAPLTVFQPDLADIDKARRTHVQVEYTRKVFRRMVLRPVPDALRTTFTQQLAAWKPYAFYLDAVGPATKRMTDAAGHRTTQTLFEPGAPAFELVGGELVHDPLMGDVFAFASDWDCLAPANRQKLAPLCNP